MEERHIEIVDVSQLTIISENGDEIRYNCPACLEVRGKEDDDAKFYWNKVKRKGFCFKCNSVFYPETDESEIGGDAEFALVRNAFLDQLEGFDVFENVEPDEISFDFDELNDDLLLYLKNRNPFLVALAPALGLHGWYGKDIGVVTPFFYREKIVKFQTRFLARKDPKAAKYYTSEGTKVLYSPKHVFGNKKRFELQEEPSVTLVEGTYDAIACAIMGFPNPLAVLGSTLTKYQIYLLKRLSPFKVFCCLDDWKLNAALKRQVLSSLNTVDEVVMHNWGKGDPEEYLRLYIQDKSAKKECAERVVEWASM